MFTLMFHFSLPPSLPVQVWDLRRGEVVYSLAGHGDTVTGLSLSPNGYYLLSNSMDNTGKHVIVSVDSHTTNRPECSMYCTLHMYT